ncbi:hypothetical protein [Streptomyces albidoflavus]|uniref:hypothetical protein n=1 Tax=Streptomyces albidoflavus TaxID=1886 RepID=UPI003331014E
MVPTRTGPHPTRACGYRRGRIEPSAGTANLAVLRSEALDIPCPNTVATSLEHGDENLLGLLIDARRTHGVELIGPLSPSFQRRLYTAGVTHWFTIHPALATALTP